MDKRQCQRLEDAGVFKLDEKGKKYFIEFIEEAIEGEE